MLRLGSARGLASCRRTLLLRISFELARMPIESIDLWIPICSKFQLKKDGKASILKRAASDGIILVAIFTEMATYSIDRTINHRQHFLL